MLSLAVAVFAQNAQNTSTIVKGTLIDSTSNRGESFATVYIVSKNEPSVPVKMAVTDGNGKFSEKINQHGDFIAIVTLVGKKTARKEFAISETDKTVDLGILYTSDDVQQISSASVVAQKPLVKVDLDKIEYSIEDDPDSKTNTVMEMLRKVPLVTVDGNDKIQVNGSSSFQIHVNGKPNSMMSNNASDVLKSMPASTIKRIEVITNPGAKYDAEGTSGILNIITTGSGFEGYTATFRTGINSAHGISGGVYASVKTGKLTLSVTYNNESSIFAPPNFSDYYRENYLSDSEKYLSTSGENKSKGNFNYGNIEASYEFDTLRLLSLSLGMYGSNYRTSTTEFTEMQDAAFEPVYDYKTGTGNKNSFYWMGGNVDYQRSFKTKGKMLTLSYKISMQPLTQDASTIYSEVNSLPAWLALQNRRNDGKRNTYEHTFQVDYTTPIRQNHTIETGLKYIIRNNESDYKYYSAPLGSNEFGDSNDSLSSNYKHLNDILAGYAGYSFKYKIFSLKTGLRYEHTSQDVRYLLGRGSDFKVNFDDLVPSVSLGVKLGETQNLSTSYNMRLSRPSIYYLNPYVDDLNPMLVSYGNPNLKNEKRHTVQLQYSRFTAKLSINLSLSHAFSNNGIENINKMVGNVLHSTYANIGKSSTTGLSIYANWNATPKTRVYLNSRISYVDMSSPATNRYNYGWKASAFAGVQHTLPLNIRMSLMAGALTPDITLYGKGSAYGYYSLSINRSFTKDDRLTVSIGINSLFNKYYNYISTVENTDFMSKNQYRYQSRSFSLNLSYRIGSLKESVKKASRTIVNDDIKEGGNASGGGGGA